MTSTAKMLTVAVMVVLAVVAAWGWIRRPASTFASASYPPPTVAARQAGPGACLTPVSYHPQAEALYATRDYVRTLRPETAPQTAVGGYVYDRLTHKH